MLIAITLLAEAVIVGIVAAAAFVLPRRHVAVRRRVIVNLKSDKAVEGVIWQRRGALLVMRDVTLHERGEGVKVDGEILVDRDNIDFIQAPPA